MLSFMTFLIIDIFLVAWSPAVICQYHLLVDFKQNKLVNHFHTSTEYLNLLVSQFYDFPYGKKKRIDIFLVAWSPAVICQYHLLCWVVASYDGWLIYKNANTHKYVQLLIFWYRIIYMYFHTWWCKQSYEREAYIFLCKCLKENYHNVVTIWQTWIQI